MCNVVLLCVHGLLQAFEEEYPEFEYVHKCYHMTTYITCYNEVITPINGQNKWPRTADPEILPPSFKRGPGRPKKLYRRETDEASQLDSKGHTQDISVRHA